MKSLPESDCIPWFPRPRLILMDTAAHRAHDEALAGPGGGTLRGRRTAVRNGARAGERGISPDTGASPYRVGPPASRSQAPATPTVSKSEATEPSSKTALMARASSGAIGRTVS